MSLPTCVYNHFQRIIILRKKRSRCWNFCKFFNWILFYWQTLYFFQGYTNKNDNFCSGNFQLKNVFQGQTYEDGTSAERHGSSHDYDELLESMGFEIYEKGMTNNLKVTEMEETIQAVAKKKNSKKTFGCVLLFIMSHGGFGCISGNDMESNLNLQIRDQNNRNHFA